jgi:hypothetical protein
MTWWMFFLPKAMAALANSELHLVRTSCSCKIKQWKGETQIGVRLGKVPSLQRSRALVGRKPRICEHPIQLALAISRKCWLEGFVN